MDNVLDRLDKLLADAEKAATLGNASFGFDSDRIEIKSVHFGDDRKGAVGDVLHPDEYIKKIVKLHHGSWIISPIREARQLLKLHSDLIRDAEKLKDILRELEGSDLLASIERIAHRAKGSLSA